MPVILELTRAAAADLQNIFDDGMVAFGVPQAQVYASEIRDRLKLICEFPESYPEDPDLQPVLRVSPIGAHIILYFYDNRTVTVLRIRHHAEDWRR